MLKWINTVAVRPYLLAIPLLAVCTSASGAQVRPGTSGNVGTTALLGRCSTADKVMVSDLTLNPAAPKQGDRVTVTLTMKSLCDVEVSVPWKLTGPGTLVLGSGVRQNVPAGGTFAVTAVWTATPGAGGAFGWADPENLLAEIASARQNNQKTVAVTVAQRSASTEGSGGTARWVEEVLSYARAKAGGAKFADNLEGGSSCLITGTIDPAQQGQAAEASVIFQAACPGGGKANPEAFSGGFQLRNGWRVKSVTTVEGDGSINRKVNADWSYVGMPPSAGSITPSLKMHLWANPGQIIDSRAPGAAGFVKVKVKVIIEGPEGTCPYLQQAGPCP